MSISKKKVATSATAVGLAAMLLLGGTFAWQSISQTALNEASDVINPGGRLHDDFNGENKDVYVENFAEDDIFARIRLDEYFEIVQKTGTTTKVHTIAGSKDDEGNIDTWSTHYFDSDNATDEYWNWSTGGQKVFMPTFNKNKDSLEADINGTYYGPDNTITDLETDDRYTDYQSWELGDIEDGSEIYDADTNGDDEVGNDIENLTDYVDAEYIVTEDATHEAQETLNATLMSMQTWMDEYNSEPGEYWVYDTDGWVYWAQPIQKGEATGLLLDGISLDNVMDDSWYYAINVIAQFITADDLGYEDSTGFYADGESVTDEALALLEAIGVQTPDVGGNGSEPILGQEIVDQIMAVENPGESIDTVIIDGVEWYVLAREEGNNRAMLFAKEPLEDENGMYIKMKFDEDATGAPTWQTSDIRSYLNDEWLPTMPTLSQVALDTTIYTREKALSGEYIETVDKVFVPTQADISYDGYIGGGTWSPYGSREEASGYDFTYNEQALIVYGDNYASIRGFDYDSAKGSTSEHSNYGSYWLRTLNNEQDILASNSEGSVTGYASGSANNVDSFLRPVMWVDLGVVNGG